MNIDRKAFLFIIGALGCIVEACASSDDAQTGADQNMTAGAISATGNGMDAVCVSCRDGIAKGTADAELLRMCTNKQCRFSAPPATGNGMDAVCVDCRDAIAVGTADDDLLKMCVNKRCQFGLQQGAATGNGMDAVCVDCR